MGAPSILCWDSEEERFTSVSPLWHGGAWMIQNYAKSRFIRFWYIFVDVEHADEELKDRTKPKNAVHLVLPPENTIT